MWPYIGLRDFLRIEKTSFYGYGGYVYEIMDKGKFWGYRGYSS